MFDNNNNTRNKARETFKKHIDNLISTTYGPEFCITHKCICQNDEETSKTDIPENIFKEKDSECFRRARHKELCDNVKGGIMFCKDCEQTISTIDIINQFLKTWKSTVLQGIRAQDNRLDRVIPLSPERLDMAAYLFSYHVKGGCAFETDPFWGNKSIHETLLKYSLKNTQHFILHHVLKKDVSVVFFFIPVNSFYIHT